MKIRAILILVMAVSFSRSIQGQSSGYVGYFPMPNDMYWLIPGENFRQWHLENRWTNGVRLGVDTNAREAWATTRGNGVVIAIADNGVDLQHPDLRNQAEPSLHYNFEANIVAGDHPTSFFTHGTPVAGLAVAEMNNRLGVVGMAPEAKFASWVVFRTNGAFVPPLQLAKMFGSHLDRIPVQNHSWVKVGFGLISKSIDENAAIQKAVSEGRAGKGVIMVRAGGNDRELGRNANDDSYINDIRVIAVAAIEESGKFATYSNPGAPILVSAPGGVPGDGLFTTDRAGSEEGYNQGIIFPGTDLSDYVFRSLGFAGTSAAAPLVSGIAALVLSTNPELTYRDVQQLLIHAANPSDPLDPDAKPNGAGYVVSHQTGFGLVDAGRAVELAKRWRPRPGKTMVSHGASGSQPLKDAAVTLMVTGPSVSASIQTIIAMPSLSVHAETSTLPMPMVNVGLATQSLTVNLTGKAALMQRGGAPFSEKLNRAADAGAEFAVMYNNVGDDLQIMGTTERVRIPSVFIAQSQGEALKQYLEQTPEARVQLKHDRINYSIEVPETLVCEHVQVRVRTTHERRGDLRITLLSPSGTTSILQGLGSDDSPGPTNWTYSSTHHFYESSKGTWNVYVSDQWPNTVTNAGTVEEVELIVHGVPITDTDADGLEDGWERQYFGDLSHGPREDGDGDGASNAREQVLGTPPNQDTRLFVISVEKWKSGYAWLSWPSEFGKDYAVQGGFSIDAMREIGGVVKGEHQRTSVVLDASGAEALFLRVARP